MSDLQMTRRRFAGLAAVGAATIGAGLAGCSSGESATSSATTSASEEAQAAASEEEVASSSAMEEVVSSTPEEEPMEEEEMARPVILVTSFGTSFPESRHITIGAIESAIREAFPEYDVRRAFTAQIIIDHIEEDTGRHIDNFEEAMERAIADGVKEIVVQPTHLMDGFEYTDVSDSLANYESQFEKCVLGVPLLSTAADQQYVAEAIKAEMEQYEDESTAICLMGHGTEAESNSIYETMQGVFTDLGYTNYFVATVEAEPTFDDVAEAASAAGYTKAVLRPMMVVAGDHANNDMADASDPESFAAIMEAAGFEVESVIEGLGQIDEIDDLYVQHVQDAINSL